MDIRNRTKIKLSSKITDNKFVNIIKDKLIYLSSNICSIERNQEIEVFDVRAKTWIDSRAINKYRIYMADYNSFEKGKGSRGALRSRKHGS